MTIPVRSCAANENIKQQPSTPRAVIVGGLINRGFGYFAGYVELGGGVMINGGRWIFMVKNEHGEWGIGGC